MLQNRSRNDVDREQTWRVQNRGLSNDLDLGRQMSICSKTKDKNDHDKNEVDEAPTRKQLSHAGRSHGHPMLATYRQAKGPFKRTTVRLRNAANDTHNR